MSKIKILSIAVTALLLINVAIVGFVLLRKSPKHPNDKPPMELEGPKQVIIDRLNFDAQQIADYEKLIIAHRTSIKELEDSIGLLKNHLYQTLQGESTGGKDSIIKQLSSVQNKIELVNYNHFAQIKQLCKPDQLNNFNALTTELARFFASKKEAPPRRH